MERLDFSKRDSFYMDVTPQIAERWLEERNRRNRKVRQRTVDLYARDMAKGKWEQNGVPIIFDKEGTLLDGQHRLWAIFESGMPVRMLVVTGADAGTYIDCGINRNMSDRLVMGGLCDRGDILTNKNFQSAACLAIGLQDSRLTASKIPIDVKVRWMEKHRDALETIESIINKTRKTTRNIRSGSIILAMVAALEADADEKMVGRWYSVVASDIYAEEEELAAVKLRSHLNQLVTLSGFMVREDIYLKAQYSISQFEKRNPKTKVCARNVYELPSVELD